MTVVYATFCSKKLFASYASKPGALAKYLAKWLEETDEGVKCFCSTIPDEVPPGEDWFNEIRNEKKNSDLCLQLLSLDALVNQWL